MTPDTLDYIVDLLTLCGVDTTDPDVQQNMINCSVMIDNARFNKEELQ